MDKQGLTEQDIRSKFISPAIHAAGWDVMRQVREEVQLTKGRVIVKGKLSTRGEAKRADYVLYHRADQHGGRRWRARSPLAARMRELPAALRHARDRDRTAPGRAAARGARQAGTI